MKKQKTRHKDRKPTPVESAARQRQRRIQAIAAALVIGMIVAALMVTALFPFFFPH